MILFHDIFTDKVILTDSYKMKLVDDFVYEVDATYTIRKGDNISDEMIGGNPSAEEAAEELDDSACERGFDCIISHKDSVEEFAEEPDYKKFVKTIMQSIVKAAKSKLDEERLAEFKKKLNTYFNPKTGLFNKEKFKNLQVFFSCDSLSEEGDIIACPILVDADDTGEKAKAYYFKDLMKEEKM